MSNIIGINPWSESGDGTLLVHYPLSDNRNDFVIRDASIKGNNATSPRYTSDMSISGKLGSAIHLNGSENIYIDDVSPFKFDSDDANFTLSVWLKPNGANLQGIIFSNMSFVDAMHVFGYSIGWAGTTDKVTITIANNSIGTTWGSDAVFTDDGEWVHVAVSVNIGKNRVYFYRNGEPAGDTYISWPVVYRNENRAVIGSKYITGTSYYNGGMDDFRLYDVALNENKIKDIYNEGAGTTLPYPWEFNEENDLFVPYYSNVSAAESVQGPSNLETILPDVISDPSTISEVLNSSISYQSASYEGSNNPLIELAYENDPYSTASHNVHFRLSFYQDPFMEVLIDTSFSATDKTRWFIAPENTSAKKASSFAPVPMKSEGLSVDAGYGKSVYFAPNIFSANLYINQLNYENSYEKYTLECGVSYYVKAEYYLNGEFYFINNFIYKVRCQNIRSEFSDDNIESHNWQSDANGSDNILVSKNNGHSVSPSIINSHRDKDIFYMAWKNFTRRSDRAGDYAVDSIFPYSNDYYNNNAIISYGYWDLSNDTWHTSGQMSYDWNVDLGDNGLVNSSMNIDCLVDIYGNPSFVTIKNDGSDCDIYVYTSNVLDEDESSNNFRDLLRDDIISYDSIYPYIRVVEKYVYSIAQISNDISMPVVISNLIELEIDGLTDARAIRIKNEDSSQWSQWIAVDTNLPGDIRDEDIGDASNFYDINYGEFNENDVFKAVSISENKLRCPWIISEGNGVKSIWVQQLSASGLTQISLLNIISNVVETPYDITIENIDDPYDPYGTSYEYKGSNIIKSGYNLITIKLLDFDSYVKEFRFMTQYEKFNRLLKPRENVEIDIYEEISNNIFLTLMQRGFEIKKQYFGNEAEDERKQGIFQTVLYLEESDQTWIKDGKAILNVVIPSMNNIKERQSYSDNINDFNHIYIGNDLTDESNNKIDNLEMTMKQNKINNITTLTPIKEYYNGDDGSFVFGNEDYWSN